MLTATKLKAFTESESTILLAAEYLVLHTAAIAHRNTVDPVYQEIFDRYEFYADLDDGERIVSPKDLYLTEDDDKCNAYYAECHQALLALGYELKEVGRCPALAAEHAAVMKKVEIVKAMSALIDIDPPTIVAHENKMFDLFQDMVLAKRGRQVRTKAKQLMAV